MQHNIYHEGAVQSLGFQSPEGPATVGVIEPGRYSFDADGPEHVVITSGRLHVKLPGHDWRLVGPRESYDVPPAATFEVETDGPVSYICYFR